jgi:hypothetical protein
MPYVGIGGTVTLKAKTVNAAKQPTDASALQLVITDPAGAPLAGFPLSIGSFVRTALGRYEYEWDCPGDAVEGTYIANWTGTAGGAPIYGQEEILVLPAGLVLTGPLDFLTTADYDGIRNLLGVEKVDLTDETIESYPFAPQAEMWMKVRTSNWEDQIQDPEAIPIFRLAAAYLTAAFIADGYVQGGTLGHIRPKDNEMARDWVKIAAMLRDRFGDWFSIIEANQVFEEADTTIYDLNMVQLSGPTRKRNYEWGLNERDWASYPPVVGTDY